MASIGHDIVSLYQTENIKSFSNPSYNSRILHIEEKKDFIYSISNTAMYWSIKESAYKVLMKKGITVSFSPALYKIIINNSDNYFYSGNVEYKNQNCFFKASINSHYCLSICSDDLNTLNLKNYNILISNEHNKINNYEILINDICKKLDLNINILSLQKDINGVPIIFYNQEILNVDVSLSHDGDFFSYVWIYNL